MYRKTGSLIAIALAVCILPCTDVMARGFGGGGRGGGGSKGKASASRGGASASRGGASASRGGASASRGGASASRGGASASRGGASASRGSASRGGASASRGGATASRGGATASRGDASASRVGASASREGAGGRSAAGQAGGATVSGPGGGSVTAGGARGGVRGPESGAAGGVGGVKVEGPRGNTATKGGAAGVAKGPDGVAAGQARGASVSGERGSATAGQARAAGRSLSTDAGLSKYQGGVSVRGSGGTTAHRTRSVTASNRRSHGVSVRRDVDVRYANRGGWYNADWYARYPSAWRSAGLTAGAIWTATSWNSLTSWWGSQSAIEPVYYDYGNTIVYQGDTVYNGSEPVATAEEYYDQASEIATAGEAEPADDEEWTSLGVWAMVQGDQTESNNIIQLAVSKKGVIRGNHYNAINDVTQPIQGSVNGSTQRAAWTIGDNAEVVSETGVANLTGDETEMLVHYGADRTEQWTLVRLEEPEE